MGHGEKHNGENRHHNENHKGENRHHSEKQGEMRHHSEKYNGEKRHHSLDHDAKKMSKEERRRGGSADADKAEPHHGKIVSFEPEEESESSGAPRSSETEPPRRAADPTLPYWEIELLKGAGHLRRHEVDFQKYKLRQRRIADYIRRKSSIYITSGGDDMSLRSFASVYDGQVPQNVSPALVLLHGIEKLMLLPKVLIEDAIMPWNSDVSRFFVLMDASGHNRFRLEEARQRCCRREIYILDTFLHHKLGRLQSRGMSFKYREGMDVYSPPENFIGRIERTWKRRPTFLVKDEDGEIVSTITMRKRRCCVTAAEKTNFIISSPEGVEQGQIRADWDDLTYILYLSRKLYGVSFPLEMDVVHKMLLAAASILLYYVFYEGRILKQVIHIQKDATREYIEYQVLCGNDNDACLDGLSTISSGSESEVIRPLVDLETVR